ncbi:type III-B CRISPR module RAMP protein Cmr6 [Moorena producens JHB]|uniref:Type III-B CRISPR module RAMP protein Cmr6 n=1 Tax=Moorena producens (strain JHB) TaxID=1454205 RepID=A0A1D9FUJ4_MOOP1|nr:type III-B CRISPR module RAMP protein Cmr6 [Moorena producens]AOY78991.1 type III-B CRISPR module RAMP protein Cmr6 [Moorena producens JHB]
MTFNTDNQSLPTWLEKLPKGFQPNNSASFVEYLRWMRSPQPVIESSSAKRDKQNQQHNNLTKVQVLQMAAEKAGGYKKRLETLNQRTQLIAGKDNTFEVECAWRMRVGGQTGPENILLPAFDALGIPYIPSSTLRGVARRQALWEFTQAILDNMLQQKAEVTQQQREEAHQQAEQHVAQYFGSLEAEDKDRAGKVIFLDAYPLAKQWGVEKRGLAVDMANNIWSWDQDSPKYSPNPNPFLSLNRPIVLIGLRPTARCDQDTLNQVKTWLKKGLQSGVGSQINTGYGQMLVKGEENNYQPFFEVKFTLEGQLIHGYKRFRNVRQPLNTKGKPDDYAEAEVRPIAFKSMLSYWFRTFALGFLPVAQVKTWECQLFGSIQPQTQGWIQFNITDAKNPRTSEQAKDKPCLKQQGTLKLSYSREAPTTQAERDTIRNLLVNLTWLMFHLGGVGQGARRPLYSRKNRQNPKPPYYRGSRLRAKENDLCWQLPDTPREFKSRFQERLEDFCTALATLSDQQVNPRSLLPVPRLSQKEWREAVDRNCQIILCSGQEQFDKPYALALLHSDKLKITNRKGDRIYDPDLCGHAGDRSPVWIADLGNYQVVTVFGANVKPRNNFLDKLQQEATAYTKVWPFPKSRS